MQDSTQLDQRIGELSAELSGQIQGLDVENKTTELQSRLSNLEQIQEEFNITDNSLFGEITNLQATLTNVVLRNSAQSSDL